MAQEGLRGSKGVAAPPYTSPPYTWTNTALTSMVPAGTTPFLTYDIYANGESPARGGAVAINLNRYVAISSWDGNHDLALKVQCNNNIAQTSGQRCTAIAYQARAYANCTKVCGVEGNSRVNSGVLCPTVYGINHTVEIYGTVATTIYGLYMDMRNEGAAPTTSAAIFCYNSNASLATAIGAAIMVSKGATNLGFDYLIDSLGADCINTAVLRAYDDGDVCNDTASTGSFANAAGYLTVVVGTATRYIHLSSAKPT